MQIFDVTLKDILSERLQEVENHFESHVVFYYGEIHPAVEKLFRDFIEKRKAGDPDQKRLVVVLNTPGGSVETVEKMVTIIRFHYEEVFFIVPDYAMSAGTILCMSGDRIYMDYSSSLGPIDPQVFNGKEYVPALGYLDQVKKMIERSADGTLTQAEFLMLQNLDLATLNRYEQARELTITLLKKWLVDYKFRDWQTHNTNPTRLGNAVTPEEKQTRAQEIARLLSDNTIWHSHGRFIGVATLRDVLKLKIEDYSDDVTLRNLVRSYNDLLIEYIGRNNYPLFLHSKDYF